MDQQEDLYRRYLGAMNDGDPAALAALSHDDGIYLEPFSTGQHNEVKGPEEIRRYFEQSMRMRPDDFTVTLERMDATNDEVRFHWTCSSSEWSRPMRGSDTIEVRDGKIQRLRVD